MENKQGKNKHTTGKLLATQGHKHITKGAKQKTQGDKQKHNRRRQDLFTNTTKSEPYDAHRTCEICLR